MKKNKLLLATAILATALGTASLNQNVKAETAGVVTGKTLPITKSMIYTDNDILMPKTTFTFEIAPKVVESADTVDGLKVRAGITEGLVTTTTVDYTNADKSDKKDKTTLFDFSNVKFTEVGVYRYTVSEIDSKVSGIKYDTKTWIVDVYVVNDGNGGFKAQYIVSKEKGQNDKKPVVFENSFKTTSLKVEKQVTGNTGELKKDFNFTLTINPNDNFVAGQVIKLEKGGIKADVKIGEPYKFALKNGEKVTLSKLPVGVTYSITEDEADKDGYTTNAKITDGTAAPVEYKLGNQQLTDESADEIVVTNKRDTQVPTGVVGTLAPFAVLSIVAIGGVIYITKRKKA
ncbi:TPA: QVPTGV class sortase B protein-sorting domain-containing protein [Streptococcus pyogenes]|uniref:QVPTGV class sortase B protein-sorting domain-containing protein n=1 Tax=Streptococcus pyogenes TaxID=1314 RepID=UPI00109BB585|nr:QVPTGV class sortase B protein-sorting domain-containing protein [Streptococcus pyogenes]VGQ44351.1 pilin [Streptococcus pyogenes]HEQ2962406.1 QVPTGV class sortase B protein-sorting domain-containing protein [Streptococcus pyogenes]HEQ2970674.1 QVPTGV class sortase B protein-sorting domain-containing protein [Streptococcus pyogenes]HEQ2985221.1 QVPTGV class sortase B protein-sorting domain-containing protein [Streptococcus pyogenes]HEQ2988320.1 QVPTGV class sortase B protein-sorting domain-